MRTVADEFALDDGAGGESAPPQRALATKVGDLMLSVRARNILNLAGVEYVGDLVQLSEAQILKFKNCGRKTVEELREKLAELGLQFGMTLCGWDPSTATHIESVPAPDSDQALVLADFDEAKRARLYLHPDEIDLSRRARNVLSAAGIEFLGDLIDKTESDLRGLHACGLLTILEIQNKLGELGFRLGTRVSDWNIEVARKIRKKQDEDSNSLIRSLRRSIRPSAPAQFLEDELRGIVACIANQRDTEMILKLLGWTGHGQRTLESVGHEYSITRERVRQIAARKTDEIGCCAVDVPLLDQALACVRARCPATADELATELCKRRVSETDFDPTGLRSACDVFQRDFGLKRIYIRGAKIYVLASQAERTVQFFRLAVKLTSSSGCANFDALCDELRIPDTERNHYRELATTSSVCEWLDTDHKWLFSTRATRNRLANLATKILSVSPRLNISEMRKALARSRRLAVVPPVAVLARFLERFHLAVVTDDRAKSIASTSDAIPPDSIEAILVSVLRRHGPILSWDRFQELCMAQGMNPVTFGIYASGSPVVARVRRGIYSLVGADIPPGAIEDIAREMEAARKPVEWGWSPRGTLWYAAPINETVLAAGSVLIPQFVAELVEGEWKGYFDGRELDGPIKCNTRFLWGLRRPLANAGAEPGDVAILEFDVPKRTLMIAIGGEELADSWETGDIEFPSAESPDREAGDTAAGTPDGEADDEISLD